MATFARHKSLQSQEAYIHQSLSSDAAQQRALNSQLFSNVGQAQQQGNKENLAPPGGAGQFPQDALALPAPPPGPFFGGGGGDVRRGAALSSYGHQHHVGLPGSGIPVFPQGQVGTAMHSVPSSAGGGCAISTSSSMPFFPEGRVGMPYHFPQSQVAPTLMHVPPSAGGVVHHQHESFVQLQPSAGGVVHHQHGAFAMARLPSYPRAFYPYDPFYVGNHHPRQGSVAEAYGHFPQMPSLNDAVFQPPPLSSPTATNRDDDVLHEIGI